MRRFLFWLASIVATYPCFAVDPAPAVAPLIAAEAKAIQQEWSEHLKQPA